MEKQSVTTSDSPKVILNVKGNLALKGREENEVIAKSSDPSGLSIEQSDDQVTITCRADASVIVPFSAQILIEEVAGDGSLKSLDGEVNVQRVYGDLSLRSVGPVSIERVSGNLTANLGLRFEKNDGVDQSGKLVATNSSWSPRFGVVWDPTGDGKWSVSVSASKYVGRIPARVAPSRSASIDSSRPTTTRGRTKRLVRSRRRPSTGPPRVGSQTRSRSSSTHSTTCRPSSRATE